ncbi:Chromoplast-specific carotenoid-associated protein C1, chromoplastic [Gracilariopsis chorda]|uniref:Chromoplast-specific carotenoid-associated protein C1, chromoplastic n=1 Tax=Gracilariopsis chorda TaxID=448386 RepID=A0A2V3IXL7_9FLOR|nr:Chromoplast-specific carotenoid-associated protein C1, chromoplastic [Gracilariopsis chorda]|eukprot:PXF46896.1 Chromoplast-specific carotenoid-associated protein C1, chromoplastic [Gracilariopsis chorda]
MVPMSPAMTFTGQAISIKSRRETPRRSRKPFTIFACLKQESARNPAPAVSPLKERLLSGIDNLDRGLSIDPDADTMTPEEADVEDLIEELEDNYPPQVPTKDPRNSGSWRLKYTSSSITRYFGGVTGLQRLLPNASVGEIIQEIDSEGGKCMFSEKISFEVPIVGNEVCLDIRIEGRMRAASEERQLWEPESVKCGVFSWFADSWKTFRAFQVADITYLDDELRITRGQTGSVSVFQKALSDDDKVG